MSLWKDRRGEKGARLFLRLQCYPRLFAATAVHCLDIALSRLEHLGALPFAQAINRAFPAEESVIREEEKHPAEIVKAVGGV